MLRSTQRILYAAFLKQKPFEFSKGFVPPLPVHHQPECNEVKVYYFFATTLAPFRDLFSTYHISGRGTRSVENKSASIIMTEALSFHIDHFSLPMDYFAIQHPAMQINILLVLVYGPGWA